MPTRPKGRNEPGRRRRVRGDVRLPDARRIAEKIVAELCFVRDSMAGEVSDPRVRHAVLELLPSLEVYDPPEVVPPGRLPRRLVLTPARDDVLQES